MTIFNAISLLGGLALFLYGMRIMGNGAAPKRYRQAQHLVQAHSLWRTLYYRVPTAKSNLPRFGGGFFMLYLNSLTKRMPLLSSDIRILPKALCGSFSANRFPSALRRASGCLTFRLSLSLAV